MDEVDPLRNFRDRFLVPRQHNGDEVIYLTGNSLGLQPKQTREYVEQELHDWATLGVAGHLRAQNPWLPYHEFLTVPLARIIGAKNSEVVAMNSLTVNLHLLMVSFYRPTSKRNKIVIEKGAFPSDQYAVESQIVFHCDAESRKSGDAVRERLIELAPREGEAILRTEDILKTIHEHADEIALILLGGVNYYTGQAFDMKVITEAGHEIGAIVGFDLAHAAGNIPLRLHEWNVDFAAWCSYKYLNGGPGSVGGIFVHENHANNFELPRFAGWWGNEKQSRFLMRPDFVPMSGAEGWQISNPPILQMAALRASLEIFQEAGMEKLREKSLSLTGYLEFLLDEINDKRISVITPRNIEERGCQLSIRVKEADKTLFESITSRGVFADWREPDVIRVAPVPLYNSFSDVFRFAEILKSCLE